MLTLLANPCLSSICRVKSIAVLFAGVFVFSACSTQHDADGDSADNNKALPAEEMTITPVAEQARKSPSVVAERVAEARARLQESEAGQIMWEAIQAHGGLDTWFANGPLSFRFAYHSLTSDRVRDTWQDIDQWSSRAVHRMADNPDVSFGWDGQQAWIKPAGADIDLNARFWALTPYYFVGVPFVLADPGVNLEIESQIEFEGTVYNQVRATFGDGVGDAPDDYYIVLINPMTQRVGGVRYIVTYPGFFPDGGHSEEKLMAYDGVKEVDGLRFMDSMRSFKMNKDGSVGEQVTKSTFSDVKFLPNIPSAHFDTPAGAQVLEGYGS